MLLPHQLIELLPDGQFSVVAGPEIIDAMPGPDKLSNLVRNEDSNGAAMIGNSQLSVAARTPSACCWAR